MKYRCENGHISQINFSDFQQGRRCNLCKNKTEAKLFNWLQTNFDYKIETQQKFNWSQNKIYDFKMEELKLLLELDGPQHMMQVSNWQSPEFNKLNDELKNNLAIENGYRMIRICQRIVFDDKEDWQIQLKKAIEEENSSNLIKIGTVYTN